MLQQLLTGAYSVLSYYLLLLGLLGLYAWRRPASGRRLLSGLNLLTAAAGLLSLVSWGYELWSGWHGQDEFEQYALLNRATGPYWWAYWGMLLPYLGSQGFWWPGPRRSWCWSVGYALGGLLLPVLERLLVVLTGMHRDYLPSSWAMFTPGMSLQWALGLLALGLLLGLRPWRRQTP
ncbi:hypothetical protein EJV47_16560 [Hymenobacter gummosus]|uniref:Uncharacterized protein n=1 Tax=Hymenobacter gummosus TaxID=1776032 RepID=A0A431U119_9BACT|nr:hypothetical protein [Hymenobacter gummosus]RTQ48584.1 hypothetical protein EJV47_16560 [Hymenobacter gummosus]